MEKELPRLQKALAAAGVASRRACETLIAEGRVQVNGKVVREMGLKVNPETDTILVDGAPIALQSKAKPLYIMLNKPIGYTSTASDPHAEHTVLELLTQIEERVYPVGRLDVDSEGLLLLTNDGEFANRVTHPRYHVPKLYRVRARGFVDRTAATRLAEGVELEDGITAAAEVRYIEYDAASQSTVIEITLFEGRNRQVRRMFDLIGHPVRQLTRVGFGNLRLGGLNLGTWRKLRPEEVTSLLALAQPTPTPKKEARRVKPSGPYRPRNANNGNYTGGQERGDAEQPQPPAYSRPPAPHYAKPTANDRNWQSEAAPSPPTVRPNFSTPLRPSPDAKLPNANPTSARGPKPYDPRNSRPDASDYARPAPQAARAATPFEKKIARLPRPEGARPAFEGKTEGKPAPKRKFAPAAPPAPASDGSTNNAAGRKAGVPYQPRPKTGHRAFGRARP